MLECFTDPMLLGAAEVVISASVGMASVPVDRAASASAESLMREADTAMYQAKSEGPGNWTVFDASMHERVKERVEIEYALRQAIAPERAAPGLPAHRRPAYRTDGGGGGAGPVAAPHPRRGVAEHLRPDRRGRRA